MKNGFARYRELVEIIAACINWTWADLFGEVFSNDMHIHERNIAYHKRIKLEFQFYVCRETLDSPAAIFAPLRSLLSNFIFKWYLLALSKHLAHYLLCACACCADKGELQLHATVLSNLDNKPKWPAIAAARTLLPIIAACCRKLLTHSLCANTELAVATVFISELFKYN